MTEKMLTGILKLTIQTINGPQFSKLSLEDQEQEIRVHEKVTDQLVEKEAWEGIRKARFDAHNLPSGSQEVTLFNSAALRKELVAA